MQFDIFHQNPYVKRIKLFPKVQFLQKGSQQQLRFLRRDYYNKPSIIDKAKGYVLEFGAQIQDVFKSNEPLNSCSNLDLPKQMGTWYEIGRLDTFIQEELLNTTQTWTMSSNKQNSFKVIIGGNVKSLYGDRKSFEGNAILKDSQSGRIDVEFLWPFKTEYVILDISSDNKFMLIGTDNRRYGWILSREPRISDNCRKDFLRKLDSLGFNIENIFYTSHRNF